MSDLFFVSVCFFLDGIIIRFNSLKNLFKPFYMPLKCMFLLNLQANRAVNKISSLHGKI